VPPVASKHSPARVTLPARRATRRVRELSHRAQERLEHERERHMVVALGFLLVDRGRQSASSVLAGALAFRLFLTLLPLTLVAVVGLGYLRSAGGTPSDALHQFGIKGVLASTINQSASFSDPGRTAVLALGLFGTLSGARTTAATLRAIHALAWGVPVVRWRRGGRAGLFFLGTLIVLFACAGLATRVRIATGVVLGASATLAMAALVVVGWVGVSHLLPHREGAGWLDFAPGAVLLGVGFAVLQFVTANWIGPKLDHESSLYGSLGVSFVVLGWLYVVGRLMVGAPLLNAAVFDYRAQRVSRRASPPAPP
jgi:uncharacterized BrkB/YihY/UPF0761 family membrane protein